MKKLSLLVLGAVLFTASCKKEETTPVDGTPQQPNEYSFTNVSYSGQTDRLDMLAELTAEMKKPGSGTPANAQVMLDMFANENSPFADSALNISTKQLKNKCYAGGGAAMGTTTFEYYINRLGSISASSAGTWSPGTAGVSTSGSKAYYFDENGVEYAQLVEKGLMGAIFYYQISETYTREGKIGNAVNNTDVTVDKGTDMEHHWDEAFGYFGATVDLTEANYSDKSLRYHAKYAKKGSDAGLETVGNVMYEFIKGRFSISSNDYPSRDAAAIQLRKEYEKIMVTTAIHYINGSVANFGDDALRNHEISEAYAFIISLHYNSDKLISDADLALVKDLFRTDMGGQMVPNFLNVTVSTLNQAKDKLSEVYGLDLVKDNL
ncbi:MAG: hypothetical protein ACI9GM_000483 [Salibacteraceae bacterium]|jgi:hypothetical protein